MESVLKVGRTVSDGVYRAAGILACGARRVFSVIPFIGYAASDSDDDVTVLLKRVSFCPFSFACPSNNNSIQ